jgi:hypothetical protein
MMTDLEFRVANKVEYLVGKAMPTLLSICCHHR